jgi:hypothetical protein
MSPPTGGGRAPGVGVDDQRFPTRSLFVSRYLEQLDCRKLDLLVPPLCGSVRAGDQLHPVDPTEVAIDEGVARMRAVLRAHGQAEVSFGVVVPQARLEVGVLVVARGWRSMTTRSTTQRVARRLAGRFQGRAGRPARTPPARPPRRPAVARRIAVPMPSRSHSRSCVHEPPNQREATISTSPPRAAAAACSKVTTGRSTPPAGPAPRGRPRRPPKLWITLGDRVPGLRCAI